MLMNNATSNFGYIRDSRLTSAQAARIPNFVHPLTSGPLHVRGLLPLLEPSAGGSLTPASVQSLPGLNVFPFAFAKLGSCRAATHMSM